jgi:hypothetical protein
VGGGAQRQSCTLVVDGDLWDMVGTRRTPHALPHHFLLFSFLFGVMSAYLASPKIFVRWSYNLQFSCLQGVNQAKYILIDHVISNFFGRREWITQKYIRFWHGRHTLRYRWQAKQSINGTKGYEKSCTDYLENMIFLMGLILQKKLQSQIKVWITGVEVSA